MSDHVAVTSGLAGIRVLELGELVSAPHATKLLADLGADVIKVEPSEGDRARHRGPFRSLEDDGAAPLFATDDDPGPVAIPFDPDASGLYLALNTNKRSIVVDPDDEEREELLAALVDAADIIVTNLPTARLDSLGFDPDDLLVRRPEAVICSISPFGRTGPYAGYRAEELTVAHGGGWAYQCPGASSEIDAPPLKVFGHQTDFHAGLAAATLSLAAYDRAERTGVGDHIDLSSMAHTAGMLEAAFIAASYMGENPNRIGSRLLNPWRIFPCQPEPQIFRSRVKPDDHLIFLVTVEQDQWERLVEFMGEPEWATTGVFDTVEQRLENEDLLQVYIEEWTREHTVAELWHGGQEHRICFAPVLTMAEMETQPHLRDRGFFETVEHPVAGEVTHLGPPFLSNPSLRRPLGPAPTLDALAEPRFGPGRPRVPRRRGGGEHRPLDGVRVLDLSWVWAGPYCTMHLAFLGAEVIKLESAKRPGLGRRLSLHPPDVAPTLNTCAYFNQWDQGKLSCQVDFGSPEGIELVKALVAESDVVVENFATGVMERLGLGYDELTAVKPDIIVASISGYGSSGPLKHYMGYGPTTGPLSGLTSLTGYVDGPPRELGISVGDPGAGMTCAFAICAAIVSRRVTGQGCYIDTALWESTTSNAVEGWMSHAMNGVQPERMGNRDPQMAPHNAYRTGPAFDPDGPEVADGIDDPGRWVSIACATDEEWRALAAVIGSDLADDPRFATVVDRKANEDALDQLVQEWVDGREPMAVTEELQAVGVAAFPSMSPQDLLADPHLEARGFFARLSHHEVGVRTHTGTPWVSANGPNGVARPAPLLGQHTDDVLRRVLGLDDDRIAELRNGGVLA